MRLCPACRSKMNAFLVKEMELDGCPQCGGLWFDAGELEQAVEPRLVKAALNAARGKDGRCKHCTARLELRKECMQCGQHSPLCPECGALLRVGNVGGVNLDVCEDCAGIFLDPGELQLLASSAARIIAIQEAANAAARASKPWEPERIVCRDCGRALRRSHAFVKEEQVFCGSCCPKGAAPLVAQLTRRSGAEGVVNPVSPGRGGYGLPGHEGASLIEHLLAGLFKGFL